MRKFFYRVFNIHETEFTLVQLFFLYYVCISMFVTIGFAVGDSLFLTHVAPENVRALYGWGYLGTAVITICVTWFYVKIMAFVSRINLILGMQFLFLLSIFILRQLMFSHGPSSNQWLYLGLLLLLKGGSQLLIVQFFSFAGDYFTLHHARRLYGYIAGGLPLGSILGGTLVGPGVSRIGSMNMLYVCIGLLALGAGFSLVIYTSAAPVCSSAPKSQAEPLRKSSLRKIIIRPYLRSIFLIASCGAICFVLVDFQMKVSARNVYLNSAELATFLGNFYMYAGLVTVLVQFSLVGYLLRRFGIIACLMLLPGLHAMMSLLFYAAAGDGLTLISPLFIISGTNFFRITLTESLDIPSRELLFLPFPLHLRLRAQAMTGGVIEPLGQAIGGLLIVGFSALSVPLFRYSLPVFSFACIWLLLLLRLQQRYRTMLSSSLREHTLNAETLQDAMQEHTYESVLERLLQSHEKQIVSFTLQFLKECPLAKRPPQLIPLISSSQPVIAAKAIDLLGMDGDLAHMALLNQSLTSPASIIRKAAVLAICRIQEETALPRIRRWIKSPDRVIRYAAFVGCGRYCGQDGQELIQPFLKQTLFKKAADERRMAVALIRDIGDPAHAPLLEIFLDDPDMMVRLIAVKACAQLRSPILVAHLLRLYQSPELRPSVLEALEQTPQEHVSPIIKASQSLSLDETSRNLLFHVLGSIGGRSAQQRLWNVFSSPNPLTSRVAAGNALWRIAFREPLDEMPEFENTLAELCRNIQQLNQSCAEIEDSECLVRQLLHDQARLEIECLFQLLSLKYERRQLEKVQHNFFSSIPRHQANALELLDLDVQSFLLYAAFIITFA